MDDDKDRLSFRRIEHAVKRSTRSIVQATGARFIPTLVFWWQNPLLRHARREKPLPFPWSVVGRWVGLATGILSVLSVLAWLLNWRSLGAVLMGGSLGVVIAATLAAPVLSADRVARQMRFAKHDPRRLTDLAPSEVTWGLALVTLWRLRWLVVAGLAVTPTLVIGLLRLDVANFAAWQDSVQALGSSTPASAVTWLPPDGHIPYFRLSLRALSAGLLPWVLLPLLAQLGVTSALVLRNASLSPLVGLLGGVLLSGLIVLIWDGLARTPLLAGGLEIVRLALVFGLLAGGGASAVWVKGKNGALLVSAHSQKNTTMPS